MANQNIFCNTPWYEVHIYWDGALGICCQESHKLSTDPKYNIQKMSIQEWFNSEPVRQFRKNILGKEKLNICNRCYGEEAYNGSSRRHRSNQKSVIFTKQAFKESFEQSPGYDHFMFSQGMDGLTDTMPMDLHIDLGNHCNLACKMCWPGASTRIASQYVKWGLPADQYLGVDWTQDDAVWNKFLNEVIDIPKLKNIHLMGGETLLSPRFEQLIDSMITHGRLDVCFSFVTNGTVYKPDLIEKLKKFPRVGIEISIETATEHNNYIRQGSYVNEVLSNIKLYKQQCDGSKVSLTLRPAISALSIGRYYTLLEFCLQEQLLIKSLMVVDPFYMMPTVLPLDIRQNYKEPYEKLLNKLDAVDISIDYNESDPANYQQSIKQQSIHALSLLDGKPLLNNHLSDLITWCKRWDKEFKFNMLSLYPEFKGLNETV